MEVKEKLLAEINEKLDSLQKTVSAIDASITGDERRGVVGIKQHIETLQENFEDHTKQDGAQFNSIRAIQTSFSNTLSNAKYWIAGAMFVSTGIFAIIVAFIKIIKF